MYKEKKINSLKLPKIKIKKIELWTDTLSHLVGKTAKTFGVVEISTEKFACKIKDLGNLTG